MNEDKKKISFGSGSIVMAISAIGLLIGFLMGMFTKKRFLSTALFLVSFAGMAYGAMRHFSAQKTEDDELFSIELEGDEEQEAEEDA